MGHDGSIGEDVFEKESHNLDTKRILHGGCTDRSDKNVFSDEECPNKDVQGPSVNIGIRQRAKNLGTIVHMFSH